MSARTYTRADVRRYTMSLALLVVGVPMLVTASLLHSVEGLSDQLFWALLGVATLVPSLIAIPIIFGALAIMRMLRKSIDNVDNLIKYDQLTGALNRSHFLDRMRARQVGGMIMIVDVDHFKNVNDSFGHDVGDRALITVTNALTTTVADKGLVGRLGGEEFAIFLPGIEVNEAARIADALCAAVRKCKAGGKPMSISIGGAVHLANSPIGHSLKIADERLYAAKESGRDRFILSQPKITPKRQPSIARR